MYLGNVKSKGIKEKIIKIFFYLKIKDTLKLTTWKCTGLCMVV